MTYHRLFKEENPLANQEAGCLLKLSRETQSQNKRYLCSCWERDRRKQSNGERVVCVPKLQCLFSRSLATPCKATDMETMIYLDQENGRLTTPSIKSHQNRLLSATDMDTMIYLDQENGRLTTPSIKSRQNRLHSAPDPTLRTPLTGKAHLGVPLPKSSRKALGVVNKIVTTTACHEAGEKIKPAEAKYKVPAQPAGEELPEIEKFFPYNPSEFETYSVPDEVYLSRFSLAGLGKQTWRPASPVEEPLEACLPLSPLKMPRVEYIDEMEAFLQTINELTDVDLPPECNF